MKTIWVNGTFDVLHLGHIKLLRYAKSLGDKLVVGIDSDSRVKELKGPGRPFNDLEARVKFMAAIRYVDEIRTFSSEEELIEIISDIKPSVMVVGSDYLDKRVIGSDHAGEVKYFDRIGDWSTTKILQSRK